MNRYRPFVRPFAKVFLGAIFTYQVIRWTWLKLEMDEIKLERNSESSVAVAAVAVAVAGSRPLFSPSGARCYATG